MIQEPCKKCGEYHNNCYKLTELTDEGIDSIWAEMSEQCDEEFIDMKQFAKAILRKAQDK